jgi:hypothetical protein
MWCPGDFEQLPTRRLADPVTRTLNQSSRVFVGNEYENRFFKSPNFEIIHMPELPIFATYE